MKQMRDDLGVLIGTTVLLDARTLTFPFVYETERRVLGRGQNSDV